MSDPKTPAPASPADAPAPDAEVYDYYLKPNVGAHIQNGPNGKEQKISAGPTGAFFQSTDPGLAEAYPEKIERALRSGRGRKPVSAGLAPGDYGLSPTEAARVLREHALATGRLKPTQQDAPDRPAAPRPAPAPPAEPAAPRAAEPPPPYPEAPPARPTASLEDTHAGGDWDTLAVPDLKAVAELEGVDVGGARTKADLVKALRAEDRRRQAAE